MENNKRKNKRKVENKKEDVFEKAFGSWKDAGIEDSVEYVREIRKGWEKRAKRLGLR
jgi:hypothetical protein